jgi:hypothetical protein
VKSSAHKPYIFTKCSMRWHADRSIYNSLKAASLAEEVEASLRRLQVEAIDLYQIHWPNPDSEIEEGWEALNRLREQGKLRWIGVSNFNVDQMKRAQKIAPITSLQPPYSMLRRAIEAEIFPFVQANGIGVINYSPMLSGLLAGKMTPERIAALPPDDWRHKSRASAATCAWWNCCARSAKRTVSLPAWSPWRGRCTTPPSPQPLWAAAARGKWKKPQPRSLSASRTTSTNRSTGSSRRIQLRAAQESRRQNKNPGLGRGSCLRGTKCGYIAATKSGTMTAA